MSNCLGISSLKALVVTVSCFFEFLRHILGSGIADGDEHFAVRLHLRKSLFAVLRHRVAISFASKLSSDSLLPARQVIAVSECERGIAGGSRFLRTYDGFFIKAKLARMIYD